MIYKDTIPYGEVVCVAVNGHDYFLRGGSTYNGEDPGVEDMVKEFPQFFEPVEEPKPKTATKRASTTTSK